MPKRIFIVDDSSFMRALIQKIIEGDGYETNVFGSGEEALERLSREKPDMVLLDGVMTGMSGYDVLKILRDDFRYNLIPIIMITGSSEDEDKFKGLEMGADDYIVKPFNSRELLARVRNTFVRLDRNRGANPLTGMRGNNDIEMEIASRLECGLPFAILYFDLNSFKPYNDIYGFSNGDLVIKMTGDVIDSATLKCGTASDFIGHIGGDDFVVITEPENAEQIAQETLRRFDSAILDFYTPGDRERGYITAGDRTGRTVRYGIVGLSIAIVDTGRHEVLSSLHLSPLAAEVKAQAKRAAGGKSAYVIG